MSGENTLEFIIYIAIKNTEARYQIEYLKTKGYLIFPVHVRGKNGFTKKKNHLTGEKYVYINITHSRGAPLKVQIKFLFL